jgi:hypothetical protein
MPDVFLLCLLKKNVYMNTSQTTDNLKENIHQQIAAIPVYM